jgi:transposase-like protein
MSFARHRGMEWPHSPVESASDRFVPEHCPWPACADHRLPRGRPYRFHRHGVFVRKTDRRAVPRFRCLSCKRTFSQQTFACSYYLKRPELSVPIAAGLNAGSAHRQLARSLGCAPSTVTRRAARLGRHALLLCALALDQLPIDEPVVFDHFESFEFSQDLPVGVGTAVGQQSWFVYDVAAARHRRVGRTTPSQRARLRRRRASGQTWPRGTYRRSFREVLDHLLELAGPGREISLITDDHPAYRAELSTHPGRTRVSHRSFRNPPRGPKGSPRSGEALRRDREMFAADLLHSLMRHTCAHHRRETIAFSRRVNAMLERTFLLAVWRNFVKRRSERRRHEPTPAMHLGLTTEPWSWTRLLAKRLFPSRTAIPPAWRKIYRRDWITRVVGPNRRHRLANAY